MALKEGNAKLEELLAEECSTLIKRRAVSLHAAIASISRFISAMRRSSSAYSPWISVSRRRIASVSSLLPSARTRG